MSQGKVQMRNYGFPQREITDGSVLAGGGFNLSVEQDDLYNRHIRHLPSQPRIAVPPDFQATLTEQELQRARSTNIHHTHGPYVYHNMLQPQDRPASPRQALNFHHSDPQPAMVWVMGPSGPMLLPALSNQPTTASPPYVTAMTQPSLVTPNQAASGSPQDIAAAWHSWQQQQQQIAAAPNNLQRRPSTSPATIRRPSPSGVRASYAEQRFGRVHPQLSSSGIRPRTAMSAAAGATAATTAYRTPTLSTEAGIRLRSSGGGGGRSPASNDGRSGGNTVSGYSVDTVYRWSPRQGPPDFRPPWGSGSGVAATPRFERGTGRLTIPAPSIEEAGASVTTVVAASGVAQQQQQSVPGPAQALSTAATIEASEISGPPIHDSSRDTKPNESHENTTKASSSVQRHDAAAAVLSQGLRHGATTADVLSLQGLYEGRNIMADPMSVPGAAAQDPHHTVMTVTPAALIPSAAKAYEIASASNQIEVDQDQQGDSARSVPVAATFVNNLHPVNETRMSTSAVQSQTDVKDVSAATQDHAQPASQPTYPPQISNRRVWEAQNSLELNPGYMRHGGLMPKGEFNTSTAVQFQANQNHATHVVEDEHGSKEAAGGSLWTDQVVLVKDLKLQRTMARAARVENMRLAQDTDALRRSVEALELGLVSSEFVDKHTEMLRNRTAWQQRFSSMTTGTVMTPQYSHQRDLMAVQEQRALTTESFRFDQAHQGGIQPREQAAKEHSGISAAPAAAGSVGSAGTTGVLSRQPAGNRPASVPDIRVRQRWVNVQNYPTGNEDGEHVAELLEQAMIEAEKHHHDRAITTSLAAGSNNGNQLRAHPPFDALQVLDENIITHQNLYPQSVPTAGDMTNLSHFGMPSQRPPHVHAFDRSAYTDDAEEGPSFAQNGSAAMTALGASAMTDSASGQHLSAVPPRPHHPDDEARFFFASMYARASASHTKGGHAPAMVLLKGAAAAVYGNSHGGEAALIHADDEAKTKGAASEDAETLRDFSKSYWSNLEHWASHQQTASSLLGLPVGLGAAAVPAALRLRAAVQERLDAVPHMVPASLIHGIHTHDDHSSEPRSEAESATADRSVVVEATLSASRKGEGEKQGGIGEGMQGGTNVAASMPQSAGDAREQELSAAAPGMVGYERQQQGHASKDQAPAGRDADSSSTEDDDSEEEDVRRINLITHVRADDEDHADKESHHEDGGPASQEEDESAYDVPDTAAGNKAAYKAMMMRVAQEDMPPEDTDHDSRTSREVTGVIGQQHHGKGRRRRLVAVTPGGMAVRPLDPLLHITYSDDAVQNLYQLYRSASRPLPAFHEGESPYRTRIRVHHRMMVLEQDSKLKEKEHDVGGSSSSGISSSVHNDEEEEEEEEEGEELEGGEDGDDELGEGNARDKERRKKRSRVQQDRITMDHAKGLDSEEEEEEEEDRAVHDRNQVDMSTEAMVARIHAGEDEDESDMEGQSQAENYEAEVTERDEEGELEGQSQAENEAEVTEREEGELLEGQSGHRPTGAPTKERCTDDIRIVDRTTAAASASISLSAGTSAAHPHEAAQQLPAAAIQAAETFVSKDPAIVARLSKLMVHEDLLATAITPRPPHYGCYEVIEMMGSARSAQAVHGNASPHFHDDNKHNACSVTYKHMRGRTVRDRQLVMEAAYAELSMTGRARMPAAYIAKDKHLQEQREYLEELIDREEDKQAAERERQEEEADIDAQINRHHQKRRELGAIRSSGHNNVASSSNTSPENKQQKKGQQGSHGGKSKHGDALSHPQRTTVSLTTASEASDAFPASVVEDESLQAATSLKSSSKPKEAFDDTSSEEDTGSPNTETVDNASAIIGLSRKRDPLDSTDSDE